MCLHDRYKELVSERERLLVEEMRIMNQDFVNYASQLMIAIKIHNVDKRIREIENNMKGEN